MKTKLIGTIWRGSASVDPRFSAAMLKWIVADIRNRESFTKLSIGIENGVLETYNTDFELQFKHQIKHIIGMCLISAQKNELKNSKIPNIEKIMESNFVQLSGSKNGFIYLLKIPIDPLLHIYLYESDSIVDIVNLIQMIQNFVQTSYESFGQIPQNIISKSADSSDDSLKKILSRNGVQTTPASNLKLSVSIKERGSDVRPRLISSKSYTSGFNHTNKQSNLSNSTTMANISLQAEEDAPPNHSQFFEIMFLKKVDLLENYDAQVVINDIAHSTESEESLLEISSNDDDDEEFDDEKIFEQNRIMVLLIGHDLRLISPDRKQTLLCKSFNDISNFCQGSKFSDHFVLVFRNLVNAHNFMGFIFKCQAKQIVDDVMSAISLMKLTKKKENLQIIACESCPMLWYHNLCVDIEGMSDKKTHAYIKNQIEKLSVDEQNIVLTKYNGVDDVGKNSLSEQNQFLMMLLRAHCEYKNERHIHDLEGNKHFFTQPLSSKTFFMKAKRSLTNSFDHLLKRKNNRDEIKNTERINLSVENKYHDNENIESTPSCSSAIIIDKSPSTSSMRMMMMTSNSHHTNIKKETSPVYVKSWRQEIFQRVITPSKNFNKSLQETYLSPLQLAGVQQRSSCDDNVLPRTREQLRTLWKTAIRQIIMLSRMEKENAQLQAKQNENEIKRIKLEYEDISFCAKDSNDNWDDLMKLENNNRITLLQAIKNGVSRQKRGDIWLFLAEQHTTSVEIDHKKFVNFKTPYKELLKSFTEHQHAIFIDLGRTFPNHKFYKQSLGVGQLSLFNLLKAYSILDPELGYCQGLGFICGILLLHLDENEAFEMLKYLMFNREMRLKYLPEMKHFQLQLYQLSRLIKDYLPDLYDWLEKKDISTTLYAAPWILTIFSSQFSLGFVTRVFDLLFLESSEIIFKVSLALLIIHKNHLLSLDNFEDVIDYLKNVIPKVDTTIMERVLKIVFTTNITILLNEYQIEYNVLQEEINLQNQQFDILENTKKENQNLNSQLQMAQTCIHQLEELQIFQRTEIDQLQSKIKNFQTTLEFLQSFVNLLIELNKNIEIPLEIKNLFLQFNTIEGQLALNSTTVEAAAASQKVTTPTLKKEHVDHVLKFIENLLMDEQNLSYETSKFLEKIRDHFKKSLFLNIDLVQVDSGVSTPVSPEHI